MACFICSMWTILVKHNHISSAKVRAQCERRYQCVSSTICIDLLVQWSVPSSGAPRRHGSPYWRKIHQCFKDEGDWWYIDYMKNKTTDSKQSTKIDCKRHESDRTTWTLWKHTKRDAMSTWQVWRGECCWMTMGDYQDQVADRWWVEGPGADCMLMSSQSVSTFNFLISSSAGCLTIAFGTRISGDIRCGLREIQGFGFNEDTPSCFRVRKTRGMGGIILWIPNLLNWSQDHRFGLPLLRYLGRVRKSLVYQVKKWGMLRCNISARNSLG